MLFDFFEVIWTLVKVNSSDGRVETVSVLGAVDSGLISSRAKPVTSKLVFTNSLLDSNIVENKEASFLVVPLEKALTGILHLGVIDRWSNS